MIVVLVVFLLLFVGDFWWGRAALSRSRFLPRPWARLALLGIVLFTLLEAGGLVVLIFGRAFDLPFEVFLPKMLIASIYIWHFLVLLPTIGLWVVTKAAGALGKFARQFLRRPSATLPDPSPAGVSRRDFVATGLCAAPAVLALGATGFAAVQWNEFRIRRFTLSLAHLPPALDGLTLASVSDLHVGIFTRGAVIRRIAEATNALRADLVVLPGDLINYDLADLPVALEFAKRLESKFGVFLCEGNHDLYADGAAFRAQTRAAGLRLLVNQTAAIEVRGVPVQMLGLRWGAGVGEARSSENRGDAAIERSMKELLAQRLPESFPILLAHHPHAFDFAEEIPLTFAGHTHGGQLMLTPEIGFGPALFRYWSGLYEKAGRAMIVSNGVGNWFPLRIQAPAEIVHVTLRRG